MDEGGCELNLGSMQADYDVERYYLKKQKREESENNHFENVEESSSGTEEEQYKLGTVKGKLGTKVVGAKNASSFHKDKKKTKKANVGRGMLSISYLLIQSLSFMIFFCSEKNKLRCCCQPLWKSNQP